MKAVAVLVALSAMLVAAAPAVPAATSAQASVPTVRAAAYILVNPATGETLAERAPDRELPMASTTKIMTALVVLESAALDERVPVPAAAAEIEGSSGLLEPGETLTVRDLLTALLVPSGNDAAVALAAGVGGSVPAFVARMNDRARQLGLEETRFANPHGLDAPGHHSSVADLVRLARAAMEEPVFREIVASRRARIAGPRGVGARAYESENELLDIDPDTDGVKTGMTDGAGYTLVAHARRPTLGVELYAAVIGAPTSQARARDAKRLLDWGFSQYARATLLAQDTVLGRVPVAERPGVEVPYRAAVPLNAPIRLGRPVTQTLTAPAQVAGPVREGQVLGTVTLRQGAHLLGRRQVVAARAADAPGFWDHVRSGLGNLVP